VFKFLRKSLLYILLAPYAVTGLGIVSNQAVLNANNDTFPVRINPVKLYDWSHEGAAMHILPPTEQTPKGVVFINDNMHIVMNSTTHLNWLADIFDFHTHIYSIGDFLIELGGWLDGFALPLWAGAVLRKLFAE
jgi:hypothetical protein